MSQAPEMITVSYRHIIQRGNNVCVSKRDEERRVRMRRNERDEMPPRKNSFNLKSLELCGCWRTWRRWRGQLERKH